MAAHKWARSGGLLHQIVGSLLGVAGGSGVLLEPVLVGDQHTAIVKALLGRFAIDPDTGRWVLRSGCGGLVVLSGQSGMGKSRIAREVYRGLHAKQSEPEYWPELTPTGGATVPDGADAGLAVFGFRKSIGPDSKGFVWPAGSVPDFLWWQIGCQQATGDGFLDAQGLFANELLYHREPAWFGWTRAVGGKRWGKQAKALLPKVGIELAKTIREEGTAAILAEVAGQAVPFGGTVAKGLLAIGGAAVHASDRQMRFTMDTRLGTDTGGNDDPTDMLTAVVSSLAVPGFPVVVAVEDLHDADEPTLELLARLTGPQFADRVLVLATGWPEALTSRTFGDDTLTGWLQQVGAETVQVGPLDAGAVTDLVSGQFPGTATDRVAAIAARWTNPLAVALVLDLLSGDGAIHGDAIVATDAQIAVIPADLAGLYDAMFARLPRAARRAVILDVICGADPHTAKDFNAVPGPSASWNLVDPTCVLDAAAHQGLTPDAIDHGAAVKTGWLIAEQEWVRPREPGLAAAAWRAISSNRLGQAAPLIRAQSAHVLAARITDVARQPDGTPGLFIRSDRCWLPESIWMLTLAPTLPNDPEVQAAAARAALDAFLHQFELRPQDALRDWANWAPTWETVLGPDHPDSLAARHSLAFAHCESGNLDAAIPLMEQTLADRQRVLGPDHPDTLTSSNNLAFAKYESGNLDAAIPLMQQTLADQQRVLGPDHRATLTARNNLALAFHRAGNDSQAFALHRQTLADRQRVLGPDHPDTLRSRGNLALAHYVAGNLTEAVSLLEQTLTDRQRILGPDHPDTLASLNNLAFAYCESGNLTEAIPLLEQTLTDRQRILGPDHPDTLASLTNLALAYCESGNLAEAIPLLRQTLTDTLRVLGPDHPATLTTRSNLATAIKEAGNLTEAIPLLRQTLTDRQRVLGPDHPDTLTSRSNLATAINEAGNLTEAIPLLEQTLTDRQRILGPDHPDTLTSTNNLAGGHRQAGNLTMAIALLRENLTDRQRILGPDHPDTMNTRSNLATAVNEAGHFDEAIPLLERTLADRQRILGPDHPDTLTTCNNLALAHQQSGNLYQAFRLFRRTRSDRQRVLGTDHPDTLASSNNLGNLYGLAGNPGKAIPLLEQTLTDSQRILGPDHPLTLTTRNNLAEAQVSAGNRGKAIPLLIENLTDIQRILGPDHPLTLTTRNNLAMAIYEAGHLDEAIPLLDQTLTDRQRILGPDHPDTLTSLNNLATARRKVRELGKRGPTSRADSGWG